MLIDRDNVQIYAGGEFLGAGARSESAARSARQ